MLPRILTGALFASLLAVTSLEAQQAPSGPLTDQRIVNLAHAGLSSDELARVIATAPQVSFDIRPAATDAMMNAGISEDTIKAMAARENAVVPTQSTLVSKTLQPE